MPDNDNPRTDGGRVASIGRSEADEARNRSFGAGLVDDPYPTYHRLLTECPVHHGGVGQHFGIDVVDAYAAGAESYTAFGYAACVDVLRNDRAYSNEWYAPSLNTMIGPNMLGMDEPAHKRQRLLLQGAFSKREMRWWRSDIVEPIVRRALDDLAPLGRADLYADFAAFIPARVIVEAIGLPEHDLAQFFEWAILMTSSVETPERRAEAANSMADYIGPLCVARRAAPRRDLISILVTATVADDDVAEGEVVDRHPLSDDEINGFVRLLLVGGTSTTYRAFGMLLYLLLTNPDQLAILQADPSLASNAIEEALRLEQPLVQWGRLTTRDVELGGVTIPAGCPVNVNVGAANHDPAEWADPDRFDIERAHPDRHLTFGFGKHHCLGVHLARMELDVMLAMVLERLPGLRLESDDGVGLTGLGFRMVTKLPCAWDVA
jgi:cytochrome P450